MTENPPSPERIMDVGMGFQPSMALLAAVELDVFTELARRPAGADELRDRLGLHPRGARDFFDTLVALGFLLRQEGVYRNAPDADAYLDRAKPSFVHSGSLLEMAGDRLYGFWGNLAEALRTGKRQSEDADREHSNYEAMYADSERVRKFLTSMTGVSHAANVEIARRFPWSSYGSVADLGTAQGDLAVQILLANPHMRGIGLDLPVAAEVFRAYVAENGLSDRLEFTAGDFFVDHLPPADVYTFGHVLHNWDLEKKRLLLRRAHRALPEGGAVICYDAVIDDDRSRNVGGLLMSLNMLTATEEGVNYTAADCREWMREAGFTETRAEHLTGPDSMIVGIK
ncbi:methyltransferase [Streptomyces sp. DSM 44917]|uniref:Methyltransferase n=1 Tax=Streptomyces boetiae TaxID=3075541 RepID=A0ABU2L4L5_9ACTN|nr:methyltransferase [Streptomyces sp. DSM 44917]MDT0306500.1 methyltransferase [Streptomyces sp. DSM 44917]